MFEFSHLNGSTSALKGREREGIRKEKDDGGREREGEGGEKERERRETGELLHGCTTNPNLNPIPIWHRFKTRHGFLYCS